jgi:hypothetical protein
MTDKNGEEIKTGNMVVIAGAYFKCDNGLYKVIHSPGDADWLGNEYSLHKMNKNGTESKCKYKLAFWPLSAVTNSYEKNAEAIKHNAEYATIEVIQP